MTDTYGLPTTTKAQAKRDNMTILNNIYGLSFKDAHHLQGIAGSLHRLAEQKCNYGLSARQETRMDRLFEEARALLEGYNLHTYHQADPTGWPLLVDRKPIAESDTVRPDRVCPY